MKFKKGTFLNYSLIDLSDDEGKSVRDGNGFFTYNSLAINENHSHSIIFVHGYNNNFFEALETTYKYFMHLSVFRKYNENFIGIYWPGDTGPILFGRACDQADSASQNLSSLINYIVKHSEAPSHEITLIAHSLGNRISAKAIQRLKSQYNITPVKNFIQLAPAIYANSYAGKFKDVSKLVKNIVIYYSKNDKVLLHAYDVWSNFFRFKGGKKYRALGYKGPYGKIPANIHPIDANKITRTKVDHSTYLKHLMLIKNASKNIV